MNLYSDLVQMDDVAARIDVSVAKSRFYLEYYRFYRK